MNNDVMVQKPPFVEADREAFRIVTPEGHVYRIFANGFTEGFPEGSVIINRVPGLIRRELADAVAA